MKKRVLSVLLSVVLTAGILAGCGGGTPTDASGSTGEPAGIAEAATETKAAEKSDEK